MSASTSWISRLLGYCLVVFTCAADEPELKVPPPRFEIHGVAVEVLRTGNAEGVIRFTNRGPEVRLWKRGSSLGDFSYRLDFRDPSSGIHYVVLRIDMSRTMNLPAGMWLKSGATIDIDFDLKDGRWGLPEGLALDDDKLVVRGWYKPARGGHDEYLAGKMGVTLDCFVGDWCGWGQSKTGSPAAGKGG